MPTTSRVPSVPVLDARDGQTVAGRARPALIGGGAMGGEKVCGRGVLGNGVPRVSGDFSFRSADGLSEVAGVLWMPPENVRLRGTVQLVHGMAEHIGRYDAFARTLAARGFAVAGHDHLGHGRSVASPDEWGVLEAGVGADYLVEDVERVRILLDEGFPGIPHLVFGHSMGSFVTRVFIARHGAGLAGAVVCATGWQPTAALIGGRIVTSVLGSLRGGAYRSRFVDGLAAGAYARYFDDDGDGLGWLTRDAVVRRAYAEDPACGFTFSVSAYHELFRLIGMAQNRATVARMPHDLPVLLIGGTADPVGSMGGAVPRVAALLKACGARDVEQRLYPDARHELLNETNRDEVVGDVLAWIDRKVALHETC